MSRFTLFIGSEVNIFVAGQFLPAKDLVLPVKKGYWPERLSVAHLRDIYLKPE
ncbi:hypothetical protein [Chitinophaga sp. OAE865]|uniref:hypothetical protein n=1 Tax=Chitinophaga sp. OAE865 TaxID=2817898 RepID=UPI001AE6D046